MVPGIEDGKIGEGSGPYTSNYPLRCMPPLYVQTGLKRRGDGGRQNQDRCFYRAVIKIITYEMIATLESTGNSRYTPMKMVLQEHRIWRRSTLWAGRLQQPRGRGLLGGGYCAMERLAAQGFKSTCSRLQETGHIFAVYPTSHCEPN